MNIPFRVKLLTRTAKAPEQANQGDLWDIFADSFSTVDIGYKENSLTGTRITQVDDKECDGVLLDAGDRILVKTGIALELPELCVNQQKHNFPDMNKDWLFSDIDTSKVHKVSVEGYAVADLRPRSGLALKHGITILNSPATIDNSYRKEIGVILYNAGNTPYTIKKCDKIAQMLIRPLYPSSFEIVEDFKDTGRGGYGSTGR